MFCLVVIHVLIYRYIDIFCGQSFLGVVVFFLLRHSLASCRHQTLFLSLLPIYTLCSSLQSHNFLKVCFVFFELRSSTAYATLTAHNARGGQQQKRRGDQQQNAEPSENANDLRAMPDDRGARMAELVFARSAIVVSQQKVVLKTQTEIKHTIARVNIHIDAKTYIQTGQTIPAKDVFASFAHHLGATLVLFDRHRTRWTAFD